ncbi:MAG TPA: hypothetical protein GX738_00910 [Firmicutes bacterium]|nr:hypothetical protein [Bacillota bacterium]
MQTQSALSRPLLAASSQNRQRLLMAVLGICLGVFIATRPPTADLSVPALQALGLLAGAICFWIGRVFDDYVVALIMAVLWVALRIVPFETAFATFNSKTWWLMVGAMGLGLGAAQSGLLRRCTLLLLRVLPPTYVGQSLALVVTGILSAPAIPSIIAKLSIAAKFIPELVAGMGLQTRSKASAGLFLSMYLGFAVSAPIFLTGSSTNLLLLEMLPAAERAAMTWMGWLQAALLPGVLTIVGGYVFVLLFLRPKEKLALDNSHVAEKLQELGPLDCQEKITLAVMLTSIALWITENLHGISAVTVALSGLAILLATGVVSRKCLQADLGWSTLIFLGVILNLGTVFSALGIDRFLGQTVTPLLAPLTNNPFLFMLVLMASTVALRFLVVSTNALMAILLLMLAPVAQQAGISVWAMGIAIQLIGHSMFVLPYQSANFTVANSVTKGEAISPAMAAQGSLACVGAIMIAILLSLPVWGQLGLIQ